MRPRPRRGFTLVELIVVLALMATVTAVVLPALRATPGPTALERSADALIATLRGAREGAMRDGRLWTVAIGQAGEGWILRAGLADSSFRMPIESGVGLGAQPRIVVRFAAEGRATGDSQVMLRDDRDSVAVAIDPWTGAAGRTGVAAR